MRITWENYKLFLPQALYPQFYRMVDANIRRGLNREIIYKDKTLQYNYD